METKKLTTKDLMIGDWVLYDPNVFIEDEYEPHKEPYPCRIESGEQIDDAVNECYSPIPITAEILEKNGWTKPASGRVWDRNNVTSFVLEEIDNGSFEVTTDTCSEWGGLCMIRYVHQLQNLLRICHEEKEIVL